MELDVLVIGGVGIDTIVRVPGLPLAAVETVHVGPIEAYVAHTGHGVVLGCHRLGLRAGLADVLGDDPEGRRIRALYDELRIPLAVTVHPSGTRRAVNLVAPDGQRVSLYDGRHPSGLRVDPDLWRGQLTHARHVHLSIMDYARQAIPDILASGCTLSTDLHDWDGQNPYHRDFAEAADIVFISQSQLPRARTKMSSATSPSTSYEPQHEALPEPRLPELQRGSSGGFEDVSLNGVRDGALDRLQDGTSGGSHGGGSPDAFAGAVDQVFAGGRAQVVVVLAGAEGSYLYVRDRPPIHVQPVTLPGRPVVDTNGAGDAYVAGFLATWLKQALPGGTATRGGGDARDTDSTHGTGWLEAARVGSIAGAWACGTAGTHTDLIDSQHLSTLQQTNRPDPECAG